MKTLRFLLKTCLSAALWALLFLGCRIAAWGMGWPAWWTIPLALGLGLAALAFSHLRDLLRDAYQEHAADAAGKAADPHQSARMRRAWKRGRSLRRTSPFQPAPVWYLCLEQAPTHSGGMLDTGDAADRQTPDADEEFSWRRGPNALWLDYPDAWAAEDEGRWNAFLRLLKTHDAPLAGIALTLEADHLLLDDPRSLREHARLLRRRLARLRVPVYLVVNRLDCLYGMRSLVSELERQRLDRPLGAVRRERESPDDLARRVIDLCEADLTRLPPRHEAAVQAPAELERLRGPLAHFCTHLFAGDASPLRGIYLASSAPGGGTIPPLMVELPTFRELREDPPAGDSWFLRSLLREGIPGDAPAAHRATGVRRRGVPGSLAGLAAGSLALCSLLTWSFLENRTILLSARGRATAPASADKLEPYLDLAEQTRLRVLGWRLPRFGMVEAERLAGELRQRYTESYFDLKTVPGIDHVQEAALAAAESGDPQAIGNALLLLAATREGLSRNLDGNGEATATSRFLHTLLEALRLAGPEDMRQLETYFAWAGTQEWMPETRDALVSFEKYIIDNAAGGSLSWLPAWIDSLPGLAGVDAARVWEPVLAPPLRVGGAWTAEGFRIAQGLLDAIVYDPADPDAWRDKREAFLTRYRRAAAQHWREAAGQLWSGFRQRIRDEDIPELVRAASRLDDPATRFAGLLRTHLLPMYAEAAGDPDREWLLLHCALPETRQEDGLADRVNRAVRFLGSDDGMDRLTREIGLAPGDRPGPMAVEWERFTQAMAAAAQLIETPLDNLDSVQSHYRSVARPDDPLRRAGEAAVSLHQSLRDASGNAVWDGISPLASYDFLRYLAVRQAAIGLDAAWREQVYNPVSLYPGDDIDRLRRAAAPGGLLEKFLVGRAAGLWRWDGDRLAATGWNGLDFPFAPSFLEFCQTVLRQGVSDAPDSVTLSFRAEAATVDRDALERPVAVEFVLKSGGEEQKVAFRNYSQVGEFVWHAKGESSATINLVFPSITARLDFPAGNVDDFFRLLSAEAAVLGVEAFPDAAEDLRQLGVTRVVLNARLTNADEYFKFRAALSPRLPHTVIPGDASLPSVSGKNQL